MNWKTLVFWLTVLVGVYYFFHTFAYYSFLQREEMQLFIPEWNCVGEYLLIPGGVCSVVGQALIQDGPIGQAAVPGLTLLLVGIGFLIFRMMQRVKAREYHLLLALLPVAWLMKMHLHAGYVPDGTVGLLLMMVCLDIYTRLNGRRHRCLYGLASVLVVYWLTGQLTALYGLMLVVADLLFLKEKPFCSLPAMLAGFLVAYVGVRQALFIPLSDGIYSLQYQEKQMQPDSFIFYVWLRFVLLILSLFAVAFLLGRIRWKGRLRKTLLTGGVFLTAALFSLLCLPDAYDRQNQQMDELSYRARCQQWERLIAICGQAKITSYIQLNYLNMALAKQGKLADRLFQYDQKGPLSLLAPWDGTYYMSVLLSDIHFMLGDIAASESYAMEGLTLARRKGSPRMLQRLVQISLIRKEYPLAGKYLELLSRMPAYRDWAAKYRFYITNPERMEQDEEIAVRYLPDLDTDNLLSFFQTDSLWSMHLDRPDNSRMAFNYLGCSFLLSKEMDAFKKLLLHAAGKPQWQPFPIHFQEAALVLATTDASILETIKVQPEIIGRCRQFQHDIRQAGTVPDGMALLYRLYGDTFWFYYYCKQIEEKKK